jgi:predicted DNA-binding mobile mystery protein A
MAVAKIVARQYRDKVNQAVTQFASLPALPPEGWLRTVRSALGMSGLLLGKRLGVSKARISKAEQDELSGSVTLKTMHAMAEAMGCRFVYAVIPEQDIESIIRQRALEKARARVKTASTHMALEAQSLSDDKLAFEVERLAAEMIEKMPADLWSDE